MESHISTNTTKDLVLCELDCPCLECVLPGLSCDAEGTRRRVQTPSNSVFCAHSPNMLYSPRSDKRPLPQNLLRKRGVQASLSAYLLFQCHTSAVPKPVAGWMAPYIIKHYLLSLRGHIRFVLRLVYQIK